MLLIVTLRFPSSSDTGTSSRLPHSHLFQLTQSLFLLSFLVPSELWPQISKLAASFWMKVAFLAEWRLGSVPCSPLEGSPFPSEMSHALCSSGWAYGVGVHLALHSYFNFCSFLFPNIFVWSCATLSDHPPTLWISFISIPTSEACSSCPTGLSSWLTVRVFMLTAPLIASGDVSNCMNDSCNALGSQFREFLTSDSLFSLPPQVVLQLFHQSWNLDFKYSSSNSSGWYALESAM